MPSAKYLIFTKRGFDRGSGGNVLLHKLCHDLRSIGQDAYTSHGPSGPSFNAPQYMPSAKELKDEFIVVYPETRVGNPLNCSRVVRWILNTPGVLRCGPTNFYKYEKKTDLIFKLSTFYDYAGKGDYKGVLYTLYIDFEIFRNYGLKRSGSCYLVRKGNVTARMHDEKSVLLENPGDWKSAAHLLNTKEILYCYDTATYLGVLAALCGCVCMVVPDGKKTPEEWHASWPHNKFGVAYGGNELDYARQTLDQVATHLRDMEQEGLRSIRNFVEITNRYFSLI